MVQIRKRRHGRYSLFLQRVWLCCTSGILLSSAIPGVFLLRSWVLHQPPLQQQLPPQLQFLQHVDFSTVHGLHASDFVELHHCNVTSPTVWLQMWNRSQHWVEGAMLGLSDALRSQQINDEESLPMAQERMQEEFILELLEQYAVFENRCDFRRYRPTVPPSVGNSIAPQLQAKMNVTSDVQLVFLISAYQDVDQLIRLVKALPVDAIILVHLETATSADYRKRIERDLPHVLLIQFGSVIYRTDSLSLINLRIMRWLTFDLRFAYDYIILLDAGAFPLWAPHEWKHHIVQHHVWLGELTHKGTPVRESNGLEDRLLHQRLISTPYKLHRRLEKQTWKSTLSNTRIQESLLYKSTSGNQGAYNRQVVEALLESDDVMELFALSKYGCCCCLEENNWISALEIVGYAEEALQHTSTFQTWGGQQTACAGSMNNAVLALNSSFCFRSEDPLTKDLYFYGDRMVDEIRGARARGYLTARKFHSDNNASMNLVDFIQRHVWMQGTP